MSDRIALSGACTTAVQRPQNSTRDPPIRPRFELEENDDAPAFVPPHRSAPADRFQSSARTRQAAAGQLAADAPQAAEASRQGPDPPLLAQARERLIRR